MLRASSHRGARATVSQWPAPIGSNRGRTLVFADLPETAVPGGHTHIGRDSVKIENEPTIHGDEGFDEENGGNAVRPSTRITGGRAAVPRRIKSKLDEEDQMIFDLKQQGFNDSYVCNALVEKGFTRYSPQSISSRFYRIKKSIQAQHEELLDDGLDEWHEGEDEALLRAYEEADRVMLTELEKVRSRRFMFVSAEINKTLAKPRFSAKSCQNRYEELCNGTARPPPELDDDPAARALEREERMKSFKSFKQRQEEAKVAEAKMTRERKLAEERERRAAEDRRGQQKAAWDAAKKAKADAAEALRQDKEHRKNEKKSILNSNLQILAEDENRKKKELALIKQLQQTQMAKGINKMEEEARQKGDRRRSATHTSADQRNADRAARDETNNVLLTDARERQRQQARSSQIRESLPPVRQPTPRVQSTMLGADSARDDVSRNPRYIMTKDELKALVRERKMEANRNKEVKDVVVSRLMEDDRTMPLQQLHRLLRARNLDRTGTREELAHRLAISDARSSSKFNDRVDAQLKSARLNARAATPQARPTPPPGRQRSVAQPVPKRRRVDRDGGPTTAGADHVSDSPPAITYDTGPRPGMGHSISPIETPQSGHFHDSEFRGIGAGEAAEGAETVEHDDFAAYEAVIDASLLQDLPVGPAAEVSSQDHVTT